MKNLKKWLAGALCLSVVSVSLVSCIKDTPMQLQAVGDVIVQDMKTDAGIKYGLIVYVTANFDIKSGKVTGPGTPGKVFQLTPTADKGQFVYYMPAAEYTAEMPAKGEYTMEVTATTGETLYGKDVVGDEKLTPITIKTTSFDAHVLKTTWDKVTGAEAYIIRLYSENKEKVIFSTTYLSADAVDFSFSATSSGWATGISPVTNTNYVVELVAIKAETGVTMDKGNNLQFATVDSKTVKWE